MSRIALSICILMAWIGGWTFAGDVIVMPRPVGETSGVATIANSMVQSITNSTQQNARTSMFNHGLDSLNRYASRDGQVRNHYNSSGFVPRSRFMNEYSSPFYYSYRGPRGWGWYGSPIIVNNYCSTINAGGVMPFARRSFVGFGSF